MKDPPVACTLSGAERRARRDELLVGLLSEATGETRLPNGFRWTFEPEALRSIAEVIDVERRCCRFLGFALTVESQTGRTILDVTGPSGTVEFLTTMIERDRGD